MTGPQRLAGNHLERSGLRPRASAISHHFLPVGDLVDIADLAVEEGLQVVFGLARHPRHKLVDVQVVKKLGRFGRIYREVGVGMPEKDAVEGHRGIITSESFTRRHYDGGRRTGFIEEAMLSTRLRQRARNAPAAVINAAGAVRLAAVSGRLHPHQIT
jgi:hypothetical protein